MRTIPFLTSSSNLAEFQPKGITGVVYFHSTGCMVRCCSWFMRTIIIVIYLSIYLSIHSSHTSNWKCICKSTKTNPGFYRFDNNTVIRGVGEKIWPLCISLARALSLSLWPKVYVAFLFWLHVCCCKVRKKAKTPKNGYEVGCKTELENFLNCLYKKTKRQRRVAAHLRVANKRNEFELHAGCLCSSEK